MIQKSMYYNDLRRHGLYPDDDFADMKEACGFDEYQFRIVTDKTWEQCCLLVPVFGQIVLAISSIVEACEPEPLTEAEEEAEARVELLSKDYPLTISLEMAKTQYDNCNHGLESAEMPKFFLALMEDLAKRGYDPAQCALGKYYLNKTDDMELAEFWLKQAVKNGNEEAEGILNEDHRLGHAV